MRNTIAFVLFFLFALQLTAQDYHYWSEQYGGDASLLGGAAIAGVGDNSAVYYNPAAMAFQATTDKFSISANAYRLRYANTQHGLGQDLHFTAFNMMVNPQMIAGILHLKMLPGGDLAMR